jgi:RimJ/RimL family protein N-acetyltransferase
MTEAVQAMIAWAFAEPSCRFVIARKVKRSNLASQRILIKVGMRIYEEAEEGFSFRLARSSAGSVQ